MSKFKQTTKYQDDELAKNLEKKKCKFKIDSEQFKLWSEIINDIYIHYNTTYDVSQADDLTYKIEKLIELITTNFKWISVDERLPGKATTVLCLTDSNYISIGYVFENEWHASETIQTFSERGYKITHWQPLPDKPEEE